MTFHEKKIKCTENILCSGDIMKRQNATISSNVLAKVLELDHDDLIAMLTLILMKHPKSNDEFIINKSGEIRVTSNGIKYIINHMVRIMKIDLLIDLMKDLNEGE